MYISLREDGNWLLGIKSLVHCDPMATNPFEYPEHLPFNTDYEKTLTEAARLRLAGVSYKQALNILPEGSTIRRHAYYNNSYNRIGAGQVEHIIDRIFSMLDRSAMHCIP